ncbi:MAG: glycosyltransferase [Pseudodonghicola sp.]|nr:glycosyltransferase [Pseudodonghicola sp.]
MDTLFLTLGAPFYRDEGRLYVEAQTVSGLKAWQQDFDRVIACSVCKTGQPPAGWIEVSGEGIDPPTFELIELPDGYHLPTYLRTRSAVQKTLLDALRRADFRLFAIGGWIGDWGVVGARLAHAHKIPHGIWFDRVESQVFAAAHDGSVKGRARAGLKSRITARTEARLLRNADLALLHGQTVYDRFAGLTRNAQIVEDVHLELCDRIPEDQLADKLAGAGAGPIRICYVGRADQMKGGLLWIDALARLAEAGVDFVAEWAGDGPQLEEMRALASRLGLSERIRFHGFVTDRATVLGILRRAHVLLFCHMTDESPRILIETLFSATPLVGFRDSFAQRLVAEQGAGILVERGDVAGLAEALSGLNANRQQLRELIEKAGQSGLHLTRSQVFADRAKIIRDNLRHDREAA